MEADPEDDDSADDESASEPEPAPADASTAPDPESEPDPGPESEPESEPEPAAEDDAPVCSEPTREGDECDDAGSPEPEASGTPDAGAEDDAAGPEAPAGPAAACPFPAQRGIALQLEELGNQVNVDNMEHPEWWFPLEFGTAGGLLRIGDEGCEPTTITPNANADCSEGYECGGCPLVITYWESESAFYLVPDDWGLPECAPFASYSRIYEGSEPPTHACDVPLPENRCQCAGEEPISLGPMYASMDGLWCALEEEVAHDPGTHDWCTRSYPCDVTDVDCAVNVSVQIDRVTGEVSWSAFNTCSFSGGDLSMSSSCPAQPDPGGCTACIEACSGVPECYCDAECDSNSDYSCTQ